MNIHFSLPEIQVSRSTYLLLQKLMVAATISIILMHLLAVIFSYEYNAFGSVPPNTTDWNWGTYPDMEEEDHKNEDKEDNDDEDE